MTVLAGLLFTTGMPDGTAGLVRARNEQKADVDDVFPCIPEPELTDRNFRRNWAKLIQKIYEVDPLCVPVARVRCA